MFEIIKTQIGSEEVNAVSARDLHGKLGVKTDFSDWIKGRIAKYGFTQDIDFIAPQKKGAQESTTYGQGKIEYFITIDMAKELSMVENNEAGKTARRYFIECEKKLKASTPPVDFEKAKHTALISPAYIEMAKAFGFSGNQALLSADKAIKAITGYSPLTLMGANLISPIQSPVLVPSDIALRLGLTKHEPNKLLTAQGFQTANRDHKDRLYYELTEKGKEYGEYIDTGIKNSDGSPRKQIKWFSTILDVLNIEKG